MSLRVKSKPSVLRDNNEDNEDSALNTSPVLD